VKALLANIQRGFEMTNEALKRRVEGLGGAGEPP